MAKKNFKRIGRKSLVVLMTVVMVFSMIQVAVLAADRDCGLPEHTHSEECYAVVNHTHGDESSDCYTEHVHDRQCETARHVHSTETCAYDTHTHGDACYVIHEHTNRCYDNVCGERQGHGPNGHRHTEECRGLVCEIDIEVPQLECDYDESEIIYTCDTRYEYPNCSEKDFTCELNGGENTVCICGFEEHTHDKNCYPESNAMFDHIDIRIESGGYTLSLGGESYELTLAFSGNAKDVFSITIPDGMHRDDGKTLTMTPELQYDEGAHVGEFGLKQLQLSDYHSPAEFSISGTVLVLKSQVDALPEALRAGFADLPTAEYSAAEVHSGSENDGGVYYRLPLNNYHPNSNTCTGTPNGILNHSRKGYDFDINPSAVLTPITDFVVVNKIVINEDGQPIEDNQNFTFTLGNISGQVGNPISLKGGESGSFGNLKSGLYSVTETAVDGYKPVAYTNGGWNDALYVQEVQSVSKADGTAGNVTFYNMKLVDKGSMKVTKSVTGTAAASYTGNYSFDIVNAAGETVTSFKLANGQSKEFIVPAGNYTVVETDAAAKGTDVLTVSANQAPLTAQEDGDYEASVTVTKGDTVNVAFNNNYDKYVEPPTPPVPETEEWGVVHMYFIDGNTTAYGAVDGEEVITVNVGEEPTKADRDGIERLYEYDDKTFTLRSVSNNALDKNVYLLYDYTTPPTPPAPPTPPVTAYYNLTVNWVDEEGTALVPQEKTAGYRYNAAYTTEMKDIEGYTFKEMAEDSAPAEGRITGHTVVTYVYETNTVVDIPEEDVPLVDIPEENVPLVDNPDVPALIDILEEDVPLVDIPDEEVPLAEVPQTGDNMMLYIMMTLLSGAALVVLHVTNRKTVRNEK